MRHLERVGVEYLLRKRSDLPVLLGMIPPIRRPATMNRNTVGAGIPLLTGSCRCRTVLEFLIDSPRGASDDGTNEVLVGDALRRHELHVWFLAEHR